MDLTLPAHRVKKSYGNFNLNGNNSCESFEVFVVVESNLSFNIKKKFITIVLYFVLTLKRVYQFIFTKHQINRISRRKSSRAIIMLQSLRTLQLSPDYSLLLAIIIPANLRQLIYRIWEAERFIGVTSSTPHISLGKSL